MAISSAMAGAAFLLTVSRIREKDQTKAPPNRTATSG